MNPYPVQNSTALPRGARTKVNFEHNIPQVVTLEFDPPAEPREGNWGPQWMYFLDQNRIGFFDPPVHEQIVQLGARAGSVVAIVKRKNGRANLWEVNLVEAGRMVPRETAPPPPPRLVSQPKPPKPSAAPPISTGNERIAGNLMAAALKQAIEACDAAEFAASHEDVRALAITIYIAATGGKK